MKTILKNIMLFAAGALTLGFTACEEDGQDLNFNIQPGNELYAPAANASVNLDQGLNTSFEWAPSVAEDGGYITYEVLFDKADGDFSAPLAIKTSQMTGSKASLSISAKELNEVAALAGIENAKTGQIKWTVRAGKGLFSQTYTQANVLTVSRINLVDPLPTAVTLKGEAVEDAAGIKLIPGVPRRQSSRFRCIRMLHENLGRRIHRSRRTGSLLLAQEQRPHQAYRRRLFDCQPR